MADKMEYRNLGKSGLKVSMISFGNMFISSVDDKEHFDKTIECLRIAKANGVNYFDTAEAYTSGICETVLGKVLKELAWERKDYVLSTKMLRVGDGVNDAGLSRKHVIEGVNNSLARLQLDYADIVFAHRFEFYTSVEEICRTFNQLIEDGKCFYWGTSEWTSEQFMEAIACCDRLGLIRPIVEQCEYSMLIRQNVEVSLEPLYEKFGLGTTVWGPVASGFLTGKYNKGEPQDSRYATYPWLKNLFYWKYFEDKEDQSKTWKKLDLLADLAKELGYSLVQLALAWVLRNKDVTTALVGASRPAQLVENYKALDLYHQWTPEIEKKCGEILGNSPQTLINWMNWTPLPQRRSITVEYPKKP